MDTRGTLQKVGRRLERFRPMFTGHMAARWETDHLKRLLPHLGVDCVFDIGANEGQYATRLRKAAKFNGTILSFEPHPRMFERLAARASRDPAWHVFPWALSDRPGEARFNITGSDQMGSLSEPTAAARAVLPTQTVVLETLTVQTHTLADVYGDLVDSYGFRCPFLKMDTQGFDLAVARGAHEALQAFVGLQSEVAVVRLYEDSPDYLDALNYYHSQGFALSALVPNNAGHFPRMLEVDCVMIRSDLA